MIKILIIGILILIPLSFKIFPIIQVCGDSMLPTLKDGEVYFAKRVLRKNHLKEGSIYIYKSPAKEDHKYVIKRLTLINPYNGKLYFEGDNAEASFDSRSYGFIDRSRVIAKLVYKERSN
jgi:signal peptidase I